MEFNQIAYVIRDSHKRCPQILMAKSPAVHAKVGIKHELELEWKGKR